MSRILMQVLTLVGVTMLAWIGWQWVQIGGERAKSAALRVELLEARGLLAVQVANNSSLRAQIVRQNEAVDAAAREAERLRMEALRARDAAMAAFDKVQKDYVRLREDWPDDCVSALRRVREELRL